MKQEDMMKERADDRRLNNIDLLRFLFCMYVVYFHILHANIMPYVVGIPYYSQLADLVQVKDAFVVVEFFFLIGGFFLYRTACRNIGGQSIFMIGMQKYFRLLPPLLPMIFGLVVYHHFSVESMLTAISDLFLMRCVGVTLDCRGIIWYVSPFFYSSIFYCFLFSLMKRRAAVFTTGLISALGYTFLVNYDCYFHRGTAYGIVSMGLIRALAGLGAGILLAVFLEHFIRWQEAFFPNRRLRGVIFSLVELGCAALLLSIFLFRAYSPNKFNVILLFSVLFCCFVLRFGVLSRLCDQPVFYYLGKYSYSIYVMQQISLTLLGFTLWRTPLVRYPVCCIAVSMLFSALVGAAVYYLVERPCFRWFMRRAGSVFAH